MTKPDFVFCCQKDSMQCGFACLKMIYSYCRKLLLRLLVMGGHFNEISLISFKSS